MAMEANTRLAGDLLGDMVVEQAIKDKTAQVEAQMRAQEEAAVQFSIDGPDKAAAGDDSDEDPDFAMDAEEEKLMRQMAEERLQAARAEYQETREKVTQGNGTYREITEQEFLPTVTKTDYVVCAFFHKDFERCKIVDMHLEKICKTHVETCFVKIDAEKSPFFIQKLQIQMLPTVVCFENGVAIDRITGFDEVGGQDDFPTMNMVRRLVKAGMLIPKNKSESGGIRVSKGASKQEDSDDSDN